VRAPDGASTLRLPTPIALTSTSWTFSAKAGRGITSANHEAGPTG